jgi:hypothetical protein
MQIIFEVKAEGRGKTYVATGTHISDKSTHAPGLMLFVVESQRRPHAALQSTLRRRHIDGCLRFLSIDVNSRSRRADHTLFPELFF